MRQHEDICPAFPESLEHRQGVKEDLPYGQAILDEMRSFIEHLIAKGLKKKTIRNHMDKIRLLCGEIIRNMIHI